MVEFIIDFVDAVLANIVGGSATQALIIASLFLITLLVMLLLTARIGIEFALLIVSPAIIVMSFNELLPKFTFGVIVLLIAFFFTGIILALAR